MIIEYRHQSYSPFLPGPFVVQRRCGIVPLHWMLLVPGSHWYQVLLCTPVVGFQHNMCTFFFYDPPDTISYSLLLFLSHTVICILPKDAQLCSLLILQCQPVCIRTVLPLTVIVIFFCRISHAPASHSERYDYVPHIQFIFFSFEISILSRDSIFISHRLCIVWSSRGRIRQLVEGGEAIKGDCRSETPASTGLSFTLTC